MMVEATGRFLSVSQGKVTATRAVSRSFSPMELWESSTMISGLLISISSIQAMQDALSDLLSGDYPEKAVDFAALQEIVGFNDYYDEEKIYSADKNSEED